MARGITEIDVHTAADELVAAGERPTVERIRAHLGTGSPNTVTRWLETWWRALGSRLQSKRQTFADSEVPEAVAALAGEWWGMALEAGRAIAIEGLAGEHALLLSQSDELNKARASFSDEAVALRERAEAAVQSERTATARMAELQRLVSQLEGRLEEVSQQRDATLTRADAAEALRQSTELRMQALQEAAQSERDALGRHIRAVEDRALGEVDLARQEAKVLRRQLDAAVKNGAEVQKCLRDSADQSNSEAKEAAREAASQRARAEALEMQLAKLHELYDGLRLAMSDRAKNRKNAKPNLGQTARRKHPKPPTPRGK